MLPPSRQGPYPRPFHDSDLLSSAAPAPPPHLTLAPEPPLLQPGPDALDAACVLWVPAVVSAGALVLQHDRVIDQPCQEQSQGQGPRESPLPATHMEPGLALNPHPEPSHRLTPPATDPGIATTSHTHQHSPSPQDCHAAAAFPSVTLTLLTQPNPSTMSSGTQSLTKGGLTSGSQAECHDPNSLPSGSETRRNSSETPKPGAGKPAVTLGHVTRQTQF